MAAKLSSVTHNQSHPSPAACLNLNTNSALVASAAYTTKVWNPLDTWLDQS